MGSRAPLYLALALALALAACGGREGEGGRERSSPPVQTADLTGLYQGPAAEGERSRLCMIADGPGTASFGLVAAAPGGLCSGAGTAVREGEIVRLKMGGAEPCTIEAQLVGTKLKFPAAVPQGCDYYCGPGGTLAGAAFVKTGGAEANALQARDLAGDPLCG